jgi:hypothetical protein
MATGIEELALDLVRAGCADPMVIQIARRLDSTLPGPVAAEVERKAAALVTKAAGALSKGDAYARVFKADPDLYRQYWAETTVPSGAPRRAIRR